MGKIKLEKYDNVENDNLQVEISKLNEKIEDKKGNKLLVNNKSNNLNDYQFIDEKTKKEIQRKILKNLIVFSVSFLLQFSAANGLLNLQSSLNSAQNLGITSLLVASISTALSCLFLPNILFKYGNYKWPIVINQSAITLYVIANYNAKFWTLIPVSVFYGVSMGCLWTFQGSLIAYLSQEYSKYTSKKVDNVLVYFFGIFMIIFQINQIFGNVISSLVLNTKIFDHEKSSLNETSNIQSIFSENKTVHKMVCGREDCPGPASVLPRPDDKIVYLLCSIYLSLSIIGLFSLVFFFDNLKPAKDKNDSLCKTVGETLKMFTSVKTILLLPIVAFMASMNCFLAVDLSKSYIACAYGMHYIGYWFLMWGISSSIFSIIIGKITKYLKKTILIIFVLVSSAMILVYFYYWTTDNHIAIIFSLAIVLGIFESVWGTCINAIVSVAFPTKLSPAYASNRFCLSLFFLVSFGYSELLCVKHKILVILGTCALSLISIIIFEILLVKKSKRNKQNVETTNAVLT